MSQVTKQPAKPSPSVVQLILQEVTNFKGWEIIFKVALTAFIVWGFYCLKILYDFHTNEQWAHIEKNPISNFKYSLLMVVFFFIYKKACRTVFFNFARGYLSQDKPLTNEEKDKKAEIHCQWLGSTVYYTASTLSAFFLFKDLDFFPKQLGGVGEPDGPLKAWPYPTVIPYGSIFYMVQFGKHLHTLIDHIVYKRKDHKFWEMFFHHSLAVFLIFFSYTSNQMAIGILVLFVHDPCDVFFSINRIINDSKLKKLSTQVIGYFSFLFAWIFFRLYSFPKSIIAPAFEYIANEGLPVISVMFYFMAAMLCGLLVLHIYWFVFIIRAGAVMALKKNTSINVYDKNTEQ